jgi:Putative Ig domain
MKRERLFKIIIFLLLIALFIISLSCRGQKTETSSSKTNSPPVITSVNIQPEKPTKESEFILFIQSQDADGDSISYQYQWMRNNEEMTGENKNTLKKGMLKKGDILQARVTPSDGKVNGVPFLSAAVKIRNTPPVIEEVGIEPKVAYVTDRLKVNVKSSDSDGDFIYYTYQWEKNGVILNEERGEALEEGRFKKGDSIAVIVTPDDRETLGAPKKSEPLIISNSPPLILSSPPTSIEKTTYIYQVRAHDPDNDPIAFTLKSSPKGMEMDKKTGLIKWEIRKEDKGTHPVEIEVSDDSGAKSIQRYTLTLDFK